MIWTGYLVRLNARMPPRTGILNGIPPSNSITLTSYSFCGKPGVSTQRFSNKENPLTDWTANRVSTNRRTATYSSGVSDRLSRKAARLTGLKEPPFHLRARVV